MASSPSTSQLIGVSYNHNPPRLDNNTVVMAVDGSVKCDQDSAAIVIKDNDDNINRISIPVDGSPKDLTSYQAEILATYGGYLWLEILVPPFLQKNMNGGIWTNSDSLVIKLNSNQQIILYSIKHTLSIEFPFISAINRMSLQFLGVNIKWKSSHQKGDKEETVLNNMADEVAAMHHCVTGEWRSKTHRDMLPGQIFQLLVTVWSFLTIF